MEHPYPAFTVESIQRMLSFLPAFQRGDFRKAIDFYMRSGRNAPMVDELISAVYESGFVLASARDWDWREALQDIDNADLTTLRELVTAFVRADRFRGGAMSGWCADGSIRRVLDRLDLIARNGV